jgi:hypothetical protein
MRLRTGSIQGAIATVALATAVTMALSGSHVPTSDPPSPPEAATAASAASPTSQPVRIMPLGSSSTVGTGSLATAGYRGPLQVLLVHDDIAYDMVGSQHSGPLSLRDRDHEGHAGWTMTRMQPLVAGWVGRAHPDVILLQVGTNDLLTGASAATTARRLDTMLNTISATWPAEVIVAGVWAPLRGHAAARAEYARLASMVVARHRATGQPMTFVDTSTLVAPVDLFDGLHPDASGYRKIAAMWEREIRSRLTAHH